MESIRTALETVPTGFIGDFQNHPLSCWDIEITKSELRRPKKSIKLDHAFFNIYYSNPNKKTSLNFK